MSATDGFVLGVLALAILLGLVWLATICVRKTWAVANALIDGLREIGKLRQVAMEVRDEAKAFRSILIGTYQPTPNSGVEAIPGAASPAPTAPPAFPTPVFERFRTKPEVPDSKIEETEVIAPTDAEMAEEERLENLRELGFDVQEPDDAEGIHTES
jgi:hypothetical protein